VNDGGGRRQLAELPLNPYSTNTSTSYSYSYSNKMYTKMISKTLYRFKLLIMSKIDGIYFSFNTITKLNIYIFDNSLLKILIKNMKIL